MKLVKEYLCNSCISDDEEIRECIEIANAEDCIARLKWFYPYSGWHQLEVSKGMTFEECKDNLPKYYPV